MQGLFGKYIISKSDGTPIDPQADYFVLRIDPAGESSAEARLALRIYAELIKHHAYQNETLAKDLLGRLNAHES